LKLGFAADSVIDKDGHEKSVLCPSIQPGVVGSSLDNRVKRLKLNLIFIKNQVD